MKVKRTQAQKDAVAKAQRARWAKWRAAKANGTPVQSGRVRRLTIGESVVMPTVAELQAIETTARNLRLALEAWNGERWSE